MNTYRHGARPMFKGSSMSRIASLLLVTFSCLTLQPAIAAMQSAAVPAATRAAPSADEAYSSAMQALREQLKRYRADGAAATLKQLRERIRDMEVIEAAVDLSFADTARALDEKRLAQEIKDRHQEAAAEYRARRAEMKRILKSLEDADDVNDDAARGRGAQELDEFLDRHRTQRSQKKLDPNKLPWRPLEGKVRAPAETPEEFARLATPVAKHATPGPGAADLAATDDARITPAINELALSLNKDPVSIYNWVRNNVRYTPTFGSVQGSEVTLAKREGNAFDTASLLIALYRASGIPSRYVHGTIMVPAATAMNWVGGAATPQAAQQVWGQGGVPNTALVTGGQVTHIKLEHAWVEAWVDFVPSRARKPRQADAWVPIDASFKPFLHDDGIAKDANLLPDPAALGSGAIVNPAEGSVLYSNAAAVDAASLDAIRRLNDHVRTQKPDATNAQVFGSSTIVAREATALVGALPYRTVATGARYSDLPPSLTQKFRYRVYASAMDRAFDNPMMTFEDILPNLAGKKITIFYAPATQADADLIVAYAPKNPDGSPPTGDQLKTLSLPAYLINLRPELRVDGVVRATGPVMRMGTELSATGAFTTYDLSGWDETEDQLVVGQATALGLNIQGMDTRNIDALKTRLEASRAKIQAGDYAGLTGELLAGDVVTTTIWTYFAAVDHGGKATRGMSRIIDVPALSFGLAHLDVDITYSFGFARSAKPGGVALDVGHLRAIRWSRDNDVAAWVRYNRIQGQYESAMEHHIPEMLFARDRTQGEAVSAVKLIAKAAQNGQKIFTITTANAGVALPQLALRADTIAEIRNAVFAGKEVTVHQSQLTVNGWTGAGYIVLDTATGAGGYLLDGGTSGGKLAASLLGLLVGFLAGLYLGAFIWAVTVGAAATLGAFIVMALLIALIVLAISLLVAAFTDQETYKCYSGGAMAGFFIGLSLLATIGIGTAAIAGLMAWFFVPGNAGIECLS